ncbi:hypothetical protein [Spirillospora sp. CA-294931]|uniref:hypothetical protein n=1 Tax=Spirillospora sp. CA-294931 TaxID=3240042 RepID=UPI003D8DCA25
MGIVAGGVRAAEAVTRERVREQMVELERQLTPRNIDLAAGDRPGNGTELVLGVKRVGRPSRLSGRV